MVGAWLFWDIAYAAFEMRGVLLWGRHRAGSRRSGIDCTCERAARPMLFCWGGLDKHITPEHARAVADGMCAAGKPFVNVEFSDADHGFFCDARATYSPAAASRRLGR